MILRRLGTVFCALCLTAQGAFASEVSIETAPLEADVIVMGELHDNADHHLNQALWIARLRPEAVVFEMLEPSHALAANTLRGASVERLNTALDWNARGWPDFSLYHPIFEALGEAVIFGGAVSPPQIEMAFADGASAALGGAGPIFGLDQKLAEPELSLRLKLQDAAHCGLMPPAQLPGMVDVQRLRDAALAQAVIAALAETDGPIAVITGNGHARTDWGLPQMLQRARPDVEVFSIAQLPTPPNDAPPNDAPPYDAWIVAPYADAGTRPDPCDALR